MSQFQVTLHQAMAVHLYLMQSQLLEVVQVVSTTMAREHQVDQVAVEARLQVRAESQLQPEQISTEITAVHRPATVALAVVALALQELMEQAAMVAQESPHL
jgi:hypothetical protein